MDQLCVLELGWATYIVVVSYSNMSISEQRSRTNHTARLLHMAWRHTNIYTANSRLENHDKFTKPPYIVILSKYLVPPPGAICFKNRLATSEAECIPHSHAVIVYENRSAPRSVARAVQ